MTKGRRAEKGVTDEREETRAEALRRGEGLRVDCAQRRVINPLLLLVILSGVEGSASETRVSDGKVARRLRAAG
jgi:hypothetical protein